MAEIDPKVADLIRKHAELHLEGMTLMAGWRRWLKSGGPCDPRSTTGRMSYSAYRRLWSNIRLTGLWEFGRKRNQFSTKLDYVKQVVQPDDEVMTVQCEDLRILDDETFRKLQVWLNSLKTGPRGPRKQKETHLWDLTTDMFYCAHCSKPGKPVRFYQTGANGKGMQCKNGHLCPCKSAVRREEAVRAVCEKLTELINRDAEMIEDVICQSRELDSHGDEDLRQSIVSLENKIRTFTRRIDDLYELSGEGSDDDRKEVVSKICAAQSERSAAQMDLARRNKELEGTLAMLTAEDVRGILAEFTTLLENVAAGKLGDEAIYKALDVFRRLTGGQIWVHVEQRPGRKRTNVRGVFRPHMVQAVSGQARDLGMTDETSPQEVSVWLRKPPRLDAIAERVHQLMDVEGQSYREAAKTLQAEGHNVKSGNVWYSYQRWYEMKGLPLPPQSYNNGKPRKSR